MLGANETATLPVPPEADRAARLAVGRTLARKYVLRRLVGVGGMGAVYEAEHIGTHRPYAIKTLHTHHTGSEQLAHRFLREARSASRVGHPGIVQVFDSGVDEDGLHYLVLEFLTGRDFGDALDGDDLTLGDIWRVGVEVLDALGAAHAAGIIHRDIKPENVFLHRVGDAFRVKLLDFGIAKASEPTIVETKLTVTGTVMGTPHYMSPEQAAGGALDARADLWAVGAMLFRALVGFPPFDAENYNVLISRILTELPPKLADVRPELPSVFHYAVDGALRPTPAERFKSAEAMLAVLAGRADLSPLTRGLPVSPPFDWAVLPRGAQPLRRSDPSPSAPDFDDAPTEASVPAFIAAEMEAAAAAKESEARSADSTDRLPKLDLALGKRGSWVLVATVALVAFAISILVGWALR